MALGYSRSHLPPRPGSPSNGSVLSAQPSVGENPAANDNTTAGRTRWTDSPALSGAVLVLGLIPILGTLGRHDSWGAEPTLGLALVAASVWTLMGYFRSSGAHVGVRRSHRH